MSLSITKQVSEWISNPLYSTSLVCAIKRIIRLPKIKKMKFFLIIVFAAQAQGKSPRFKKTDISNFRESSRSAWQVPFAASTCCLFSARSSSIQSFFSRHENAEKATTSKISKQQRLVWILRMVLKFKLFLQKK